MARSREQLRAIQKVGRAIKAGVLIRPDECSQCGRNPGYSIAGKTLVQAHHHLGYDDAHVLDVVWLCPSCHKLAHPAPESSNKAGGAKRTGRKRTAESISLQQMNWRSGWTPERRETQRQRMIETWKARR